MKAWVQQNNDRLEPHGSRTLLSCTNSYTNHCKRYSLHHSSNASYHHHYPIDGNRGITSLMVIVATIYNLSTACSTIKTKLKYLVKKKTCTIIINQHEKVLSNFLHWKPSREQQDKLSIPYKKLWTRDIAFLQPFFLSLLGKQCWC